mmetsp:Transcript_28401/g.64313  ORF Transcript_28401/g.64313 Transcript_28401/m.64313 type:complete len:278 (+) Transcript_28401:1058-1891(+)
MNAHPVPGAICRAGLQLDRPESTCRGQIDTSCVAVPLFSDVRFVETLAARVWRLRARLAIQRAAIRCQAAIHSVQEVTAQRGSLLHAVCVTACRREAALHEKVDLRGTFTRTTHDCDADCRGCVGVQRVKHLHAAAHHETCILVSGRKQRAAEGELKPRPQYHIKAPTRRVAELVADGQIGIHPLKRHERERFDQLHARRRGNVEAALRGRRVDRDRHRSRGSPPLVRNGPYERERQCHSRRQRVRRYSHVHSFRYLFLCRGWGAVSRYRVHQGEQS